MTAPPDDGRDRGPSPEAAREPVPGVDFDPYRFGRPEHPIPPEWAPPGYVAPAEPAAGAPGEQQTPGGWPPGPDPRQWPQGPYQQGPYQQGPYPPGSHRQGPYQQGPYPPGWPPGQYPPGQYPPGQYPPPPPGYLPGGRPAGNGKAVASLVLGILALLMFWATIWDLLLIVPAIVLGVLARRDAERTPGRGGRRLATSGLVCGILACVLAVAATAYIYNKVSPCLTGNSPTSAAFQQCARDRLLGHPTD